MSVAACGGGKRGSSNDDDREQRGDEKKKRLGLAQLLDFVPSTINEDEDKTEDNDEITNTKLNRQISIVHRPTARPRPLVLEKAISTKSFDDLKGMGNEDGKELREEDHPINKKRILSLHVMSSLYKMSRTVSVPRPKKGDQVDVVDKAEKKQKQKQKKKKKKQQQKKMGNNSKNKKDGN